MKKSLPVGLCALAVAWMLQGLQPLPVRAASGDLRDAREVHFGDVRQLTFQGENAEAYWAPGGDELILQSTFPPHECDQIFRLRPDRPGELELVSTGEGRTTCAYFFPSGDKILYSSTHLADKACPPRPGFSQGYVWPLYEGYEIFVADPDGGNLEALTHNSVYDAEATVCPLDGAIVFTSTRDGDLDLYRMDADGSNVKRLTEAPGYDGGAFFSADCSKIVWRASRPREGEELDDYRELLAEGLVRPSKLELWVAHADGSEARQITYLDAATFAPFFHPSGNRILFSSNYGDAGGREFDIWAVNVDGTSLERITYAPGFDGFPMFSPDGEWLAFASNRNQGKPGETDVYLARWIEEDPKIEESGADRLMASVTWLADDARQGRGVGTEGLQQSTLWLAEQFASLGVEPAAGEGEFLQAFEVPISVEATAATALALDGAGVDNTRFVVASYSVSGRAAGEVVPVGYGISAPELEHDDYDGVSVEGKIVAIRRFVPTGETFTDSDVERRYGDLRYKVWNAREHGAVGALIVDFPVAAEGVEMPAEAPLPSLRIDTRGDAGLPVIVLRREVGRALFAGGHHVELVVELKTQLETVHNVIGRIPATETEEQPRLAGAVVVGAHIDHLGLGGSGSLAPDTHEPHNGADDNASGTAALLEIARGALNRPSELRRDLYLVAFSGEESGLRGSTHFTLEPPPGLEMGELAAMINLDMIGRLRGNRVSAMGAGSAEEWADLLPAACERAGLGCALGGDGYGPSDQTPFYAAGVPVLHLFTGAHEDYHKPSDDSSKINAAGAAQIASLAADLALTVSGREDRLTYKAAKAPEPSGDTRSYGASLGTIPDYASDDIVGVKLAGARPESPADVAGMQRGDVLVGLAGHEVRDIYDFMFVLRQSKPGETVEAVVERDGKRLTLPVTFGKSRGVR